MIKLGWLRSIFTMELRQIITYRADFWVNFVGNASITFILAYFLWSGIFEANNTDHLNGFSMKDIVLYYLIVPQLFRIQQGSGIGSIAREIYEGSLNKYLLYPVNYYAYKIVIYFAHTSFYILQLFLVMFLYWIVTGSEGVLEFSALQLLLFIISMYFIALLYFSISSISEFIAFWADNIWSLGVIIRFVVSFLGGALIPLSFFPSWAQSMLYKTPFPYLISFPFETLTKPLNINLYLENILIIIAWTTLFMVTSYFVWTKGKYKYTGVGI